MEKLSNKAIFNIVFSVMIVGVILSFSLFFSMTALMDSEKAVSDTYFDGTCGSENIFSSFNDACLKNQELFSIINETEYKLFGNIISEDVLKGDSDFLFSAGENEYGYDYLKDYTGNMILSEQELDYIHKYIEMRRQAYENNGSDYVLAVIPNAQTVYGEYMPEYFGEISKNTMLSQVTEYLAAQGFDGFINLTDAMLEGKKNGQLYNNTENSINALGAYIVYSEIVSSLDDLLEDSRTLSEDYFDLNIRLTDGKSLAQSAGISSLIKNKTVSISTSNVYTYTVVDLFADYESTYTKYEYSDMIPAYPSVLLEVSGDWDKIQLMPYFSSTFGHSSYRVSHTYSGDMLENTDPNIVIQIIHEDELLSILEPNIYSSYTEGLNMGQHPYKTATPTDIKYTFIDRDVVCVTGITETDSEVVFFGDGIEAGTVEELGERFFATVKLDNPSIATQICFNAKVDSKSTSDTVYLLIDNGYDASANELVGVGDNSMLYWKDMTVDRMPTDDGHDALVKKMEALLTNYRIQGNNKNLEMIHAIIPDKLSVYDRGIDGTLLEYASTLETIRSVYKHAIDKAGQESIDLSRVLKKYIGEGKMLYQTTDGVTDLGSYYIYREIINRIAEDHPAVKPYELDHYQIEKYTFECGAMGEALGFDPSEVLESSYRINVESQAEYVQSYLDEFDATRRYVTHNYKTGLPSAIIIRDAGMEKVLELMADHFSTMYVLDVGSDDISESVLSIVYPDYIIYLTNETSISFDN